MYESFRIISKLSHNYLINHCDLFAESLFRNLHTSASNFCLLTFPASANLHTHFYTLVFEAIFLISHFPKTPRELDLMM